jgi:hypothetical protein
MRRVYGGASLIVIAFVLGAVDQAHKLVDAINGQQILNDGSQLPVRTPASGFSHTVYDVFRVSAWALILFGALLIVVGLMRYRAQLRGIGVPADRR